LADARRTARGAVMPVIEDDGEATARGGSVTVVLRVFGSISSIPRGRAEARRGAARRFPREIFDARRRGAIDRWHGGAFTARTRLVRSRRSSPRTWARRRLCAVVQPRHRRCRRPTRSHRPSLEAHA
jgi:hypothetical protein